MTAASQYLKNMNELLVQEFGFPRGSFEISTINGRILLVSGKSVDVIQGRKAIPITNIISPGRQIFFHEEYLLKSERPLFQLDNLSPEEERMRDWTHEMAVFCWPREDLFKAVNRRLVIESYVKEDRAFTARPIDGEIGAIFKFPVFCLGWPEAVSFGPKVGIVKALGLSIRNFYQRLDSD